MTQQDVEQRHASEAVVDINGNIRQMNSGGANAAESFCSCTIPINSCNVSASADMVSHTVKTCIS